MMKNILQKRLKNEKGLTLVELLAVIVILGIIAAIAVPSIGNIITNSKVNALKADGQNVIAAANLYFVENDKATKVSSGTLLTEGYLDSAGGFVRTGAVEAEVVKADGGNKITGTAVDGEIKVAFAGATNSNIDAAGTSKSETGNNITITR